METFTELLVLCKGNTPFTGGQWWGNSMFSLWEGCVRCWAISWVVIYLIHRDFHVTWWRNLSTWPSFDITEMIRLCHKVVSVWEYQLYCATPSHYPNQRWLLFKHTVRSTSRWNFIIYIFKHEIQLRTVLPDWTIFPQASMSSCLLRQMTRSHEAPWSHRPTAFCNLTLSATMQAQSFGDTQRQNSRSPFEKRLTYNKHNMVPS